MALLFPFAEYWWLYGLFVSGVLVLLALDPSGHRFISATTATDINWKAAYANSVHPTTIARSPNTTPSPYHTRQNRARLGELPRRKKKELSPVVEKRT